jgi:hypothetical protein
LRRIHHSHNAGVCALAGSGARPDFECLASIDGSAACGLSGPTRNGDWFAGQRRLIDHRSRACNDPIDRYHLTRANENCVADRDLFDWYVGDCFSQSPVCSSWSTIDQRLQVAFRPGNREVLQHVASGVHHGDDNSREVLAERQRGRHRHESDRIDAHAPSQKVPDH